MKFEFSPGLIGYGTKGTDGSLGLQGYAIYFTDYDPQIDIAYITDAISNNYVLWRNEAGTLLPGGRVYLNGELFIDNFGNIYRINLARPLLYELLPFKISAVTFFETDELENLQNFLRYYNIFNQDTKYIIDNVYSENDDYTSRPSRIYGIMSKNFARIEYVDVVDSSLNPFSVYSSGDIIYEDDHKALALVRDITSNTFRFGNIDDTNIRRVNLVFDVSSLKKNSTPISIDTPSDEFLSNMEFGSNTLFTGVFNSNPTSFIATPTSNSLEIEWDLSDFTSDACISGDLHIYESLPAEQQFSPLIIHDVSVVDTINITDLSTNAIYKYYMKIIKDGWTRNSVLRQITIDGVVPTLGIISPSPATIDSSSIGLDTDIDINSNVSWTSAIRYISGGTGWVYYTPTAGTAGTPTIDVSIYKNNTVYPRATYIDFTPIGGATQSVFIVQDASIVYSINLSQEFYNVGFWAGSIGTPYLTSSGAWTASIYSDPDGVIDTYTISGSRSQLIDVFVTRNTTIYEKVAIIKYECGPAAVYLQINQVTEYMM